MLKTRLIIFIFVSAFIAGCATQTPTFENTTTVTTDSTTTPLPTVEPSETVTLTPAPTNTPTLIPTITWTPLPTLSAEEKHAKIQELLETNNGCNLPCWWGIIPGKTTWAETIHFLTPIIVHLTELEESSDKSVTYEIDGASAPEYLWFDVQDTVVAWISTYQPETHYTYQLHQVLELLGVPRQIYVSARSRTGKFGAEFQPAILVLDYTHIGVWASYGYLPNRAGENLSICPQDYDKITSIYESYRTVGGRLELFDPAMENRWAVPMIEVIGAYVDNTWGPETISGLEDATNMTIESFYQTFIDPESNACLETPLNLWP